jgi:hypothetical protein
MGEYLQIVVMEYRLSPTYEKPEITPPGRVFGLNGYSHFYSIHTTIP